MSKLILSDGGHIYDKNTGTWQGETQGSVGDGFKHGPAEGGFVWRDANGITGISYTDATRPDPAPSGAGYGGGTNSGAPRHVAAGAGAAAGVVNTNGPASGGTGPGSSGVSTGPLEPKRKATHTQLQIGTPGGWGHNPNWSDTAEWEERYGEPGDWLGGIVTMGVDLGWNAKRAAHWMVGESPNWNGATPTEIDEPDPIYMDGWVSYDEAQTWEKAPAGSPADHYWSF